MKTCTDDELKAHIAKMRTIHGDEPIRIKTALPWAQELFEARGTIKELRRQVDLLAGREEDSE